LVKSIFYTAVVHTIFFDLSSFIYTKLDELTLDPDPRNNGQGLDILRKGGKTLNVGLCANEVNAFLNQYLIK
ncbi:MAG: hypothetical protein V7K81_05435, partial [Nostoc sp.]